MRALVSITALFAAACTTTPAPEIAASGEWSIDARLVESCCCDAICPCIVGSPPTRGMCVGNRLVEIVDGHYGDVELDGVTLVVTFSVGAWTKYYFAEDTTELQVEAATELLALQRGFRFGDLLEVDRVPLESERTDARITYSVPTAHTDIEVMRGWNEQPIEVANLNSFRDYVQYRSISVSHTASNEAESFEHSGTNGFAANYRATSAR